MGAKHNHRQEHAQSGLFRVLSDQHDCDDSNMNEVDGNANNTSTTQIPLDAWIDASSSSSFSLSSSANVLLLPHDATPLPAVDLTQDTKPSAFSCKGDLIQIPMSSIDQQTMHQYIPSFDAEDDDSSTASCPMHEWEMYSRKRATRSWSSTSQQQHDTTTDQYPTLSRSPAWSQDDDDDESSTVDDEMVQPCKKRRLGSYVPTHILCARDSIDTSVGAWDYQQLFQFTSDDASLE